MQQWYYPFPDYKLPFEIHSDRFLPTPEEMKSYGNATFDADRWEVFSEQAALASVIPAGLYPEFANSFLVVCSADRLDEEALPCYVHFAKNRPKAYRIGTAVYEQAGTRRVEKFARTLEARAHLAAIAENGVALEALYGKEMVAASRLRSSDVLVCDYAEGMSFTSFCLQSIRERGLDGFLDCLNFFAAYLVRGSETPVPTGMGWHQPGRRYDVDLTFDNVIVQGGSLKIIDYEFLGQQRCQLYAILHALAVFRERYESVWLSMGLDLEMKYFREAYQVTQTEWEAFYRDESAFYAGLYESIMARYKRERRPWQP